MNTLSLVLRIFSPVFYVVATLHLVLGLGADALLGAQVPQSVVVEPTLSSQNRFYGVAFALYGVALQLCARNLLANEALFRGVMWVFFLAGAARLIAWFQHGPPAPLVVVLLAVELVAPIVFLLWFSRAKRVATKVSVQR